MLLKDFFARFPDEDSCISYFRDLRLQIGIKCSKCGCTDHSWLDSRKSYQCKTCGYRMKLTSGTVMEQSNLPLYNWFFTAHLMTTIKQVLSAKEIQHQLEMKDYASAWLMMMKYRDIMGKRDSTYKLSDQIELDISYFPTSVLTGKGSARVVDTKKTAVLVMAESKAVDEILSEYLSDVADNKLINQSSKLLQKSSRQKVKKVIHYIKMFALPNQQYESIKPYVAANVEDSVTVHTDGGTNLFKMKDLVKQHIAHRETEEEVHEVVTKILPWVHIVTGDCRSGIEAIHKEVDERFLQLYLNEFCWKFNRRYFRDSKDVKYDLFDRLIRIAAIYRSDVKWRDYQNEPFNIP